MRLDCCEASYQIFEGNNKLEAKTRSQQYLGTCMVHRCRLGSRQIRSQVCRRISIQTWQRTNFMDVQETRISSTVFYRSRIHSCFFGQSGASLVKTASIGSSHTLRSVNHFV